jgi:hypothetical protein
MCANRNQRDPSRFCDFKDRARDLVVVGWLCDNHCLDPRPFKHCPVLLKEQHSGFFIGSAMVVIFGSGKFPHGRDMEQGHFGNSWDLRSPSYRFIRMIRPVGGDQDFSVIHG